jgi:integrase
MLTTKAIDAALKARPAKGQAVLRDSEVRGLTLVIGRIRATWTIEAMAAGTRKKIVIGDTATHALDEARTAARNLKAALRSQSPAQAAEELRREKARTGTCADRLEEYVDWLRSDGLKPKSITEAESQTRLALASIDMLDRPPSDITEQHLRDIITKASKGTRRARYGYISRFLKWCSARGFVKVRFREIDLEAFEKPRQPKERQRVLSLEEVKQVLAGLRTSNSLDPAFKDLVRFLILVPARRNEAASARARDVNIEGKFLEIAGSATKNGTPHRLPLSNQALDLVKQRMRQPSDLLFPSPRTGDTISGWSKLKAALDRTLPDDFAPWVVHDLRRTFASAMGDAGIDETVTDLILNHKAAATRGGITGVYQKAARWSERVAALDLWDGMIAKIGGVA